MSDLSRLHAVHAGQVAQLVQSLPAVQETPAQFLGWEDPLEKEMAAHSRTPTWTIAWTEGAWWAPWGHRGRRDERVGTSMDCRMPGFPALYCLLEFAQTCPLNR